MPDLRLSVDVSARHDVAQDIVGFELVHPEGRALPAFTAGAHVDVVTPGGATRQYSLCNDPAETHRYCIGVLLEPASRGGSRSMHQSLRAGMRLQISAPRNHFPLAPARHSLLFAGGIGITPILAMAETLARSQAAFEMHCCARSLARLPFRDRLGAAALAAQVRLHLDDGPPAQALDIAATLGPPDTGKHLYVCGPKGYMDAVIAAARALHWHEDQIHREYFAAEAPSPAGDGFELVLARTRRSIRVGPACSVAEALREHGIEVPVSCEQGVCGTCLTRVVDGLPDHRDVYLTDAEKAKNDQFTPCCSRSLTPRLVIDL